uniref:NET domain-containing protein n=1 Tax=viral metagenome TaxID=1070528 RepID=A0A6C0F499_9ZZZZ
MNRSRKEALKERLDRLDANEHAQIFNVIKKYTESFTKTQSGVLISSDVLPDACLVEMEKMVTFYLDQHKQMEADEAERKTYERR